MILAPTSCDELELEALLRLAAARTVLDALVVGHWPARAEIVRATERLLRAGERRLELAAACRAKAAA